MWRPGLEGVVAARTAVSLVDGEAGRLHYRGVPLAEVAELGFEGAAELVLGGGLGDLGRARVRAFERPGPRTGEPMVLLRARLAGAQREEDLVAEVGVALALAGAALERREPVAPDPALDHAADLARMLTGRAERGPALGRYLATVMDHGLNASTFTARVVASTGSDAVSAVVAALGALKGPLHGGAPGPVLDMLDAVGAPERAAAWIDEELAAGRRIMGMGHRVYRVRDPRAAVLERAAEGTPRLPLARALEAAATDALERRHPGRRLRANVEFYTALLLDGLGIDRRLFTATFAAGRVVGWLAHVAEERAVGRIMRPRAEYVGPQAEATSRL